eukprot:scaffold77640_cov35-Prasinocladus_malaysianus.AAC.1
MSPGQAGLVDIGVWVAQDAISLRDVCEDEVGAGDGCQVQLSHQRCSYHITPLRPDEATIEGSVVVDCKELTGRLRLLEAVLSAHRTPSRQLRCDVKRK